MKPLPNDKIFDCLNKILFIENLDKCIIQYDKFTYDCVFF